MRSSNDFLSTYGESLKKWVRKPISFDALKARFESPRFQSYVNYDFQDALMELKELKTILDKITTIVFHPHIHSSTQEIIVRSELAHHLSNQDFKETVKDAKLWRKKGDAMAPEYVHAREHIDTLITYENVFIAYLVDCLEGEVDSLLADIAPLVEPLEQRYEAKGVYYGGHSFLAELQGEGKPMKRSFLFEKDSSQEVLALSRALHKRIRHIKATEFYRFNTGKNIKRAVEATNILIHDPLYGSCYRFYLDRYLYASSKGKREDDENYYNYVITSLLRYLKEEVPSNLRLSWNGKKLCFNSFSIQKGFYELTFKDHPEESRIDIDVTLRLNKKTTTSARYQWYITKIYDEANQPEIDAFIEDTPAEDAILVCQSNIVRKYRNVLNLSVYRPDNDLLLDHFFASLTLLFECEEGVFDHLCPVCGGKGAILTGNDHHCPECGSSYALLQKSKTHLVYIKSLRRNER